MKRHAAPCNAPLEHPVGYARTQKHMPVERRAEPVLKRDRTEPRAGLSLRITVSWHSCRIAKQSFNLYGHYGIYGKSVNF